jgi:hypothetical protein
MTDKSIGHLAAAMQRDPDNREIAVRLKQVCVCALVGVRSRQQQAARARRGIVRPS